MKKGPLLILSAPSGCGKSTVIRRMLEITPRPLRLSISATTREPRDREKNGVDYHFWTRQQFLDEVTRDGFLEWAEVHGHLYGTPRSEVEPYREQGWAVILDIDVQGAAQVRPRCPDNLSVFLLPPSLEVLEARLRGRKDTSEESIQTRLTNARAEMARAGEYTYQLINNESHSTAERVLELIAEYDRREPV
jgi:guanylate kinase